MSIASHGCQSPGHRVFPNGGDDSAPLIVRGERLRESKGELSGACSSRRCCSGSAVTGIGFPAGAMGGRSGRPLPSHPSRQSPPAHAHEACAPAQPLGLGRCPGFVEEHSMTGALASHASN